MTAINLIVLKMTNNVIATIIPHRLILEPVILLCCA